LMFKFACVVLFLSALYISGEAHAILRFPVPWIGNPSKASPCGGANTLTAPAAAWKIGSTVNVTWQVIAGDGVGTVNITFDTTGAQAFQQGISVQIGSAPALELTYSRLPFHKLLAMAQTEFVLPKLLLLAVGFLVLLSN